MTVSKLVQWIRLGPTFLCLALPAAADESRWWPVQTMPKAIVRTINQSWNGLNHRPRAGTPAKVAREIRQTLEKTREDQPRYD